MKKFVFIILFVVMSAFISYKCMYIVRNKTSLYKDNGIYYMSKVDNKSFYIDNLGVWKKQFIKGVNIGAAKPGYFPGELPVTKDEYKRWFKYMANMNVNNIRVYTVMKPEFYDALYEYNKESLKPIYLFQGVWVNENDIANIKNANDPRIKNSVKSDIKDLVDIIHGKATISPRKGYASGTYTKDVSPYVVGWILGIEWDPNFVLNTNSLSHNVTSYSGNYLYTKDASPFESFLCEIGDYTISYETSNYKMQRPVSFTNWVTTDLLSHPNEPLQDEDIATVNTEHIKKKASFKPGLFASYHIYPYYPDSMNYQHEYANFRDKDGGINTYKAYLKDLIEKHTVPVLVAEFGVPASRGMTHENIYTGFNQGGVDETKQGEDDVSMLKDIYDEGYAGGLVFTWQDEWFKRTWNTMDYDLPDRRAYWSNPQTNEQEFGLLAFDPGNKKSICYVDGNISDWKKDKPIVQNNKFKLYVKSDEKYVYFLANVKNFDLNKDTFTIPIDITPNSGNLNYKDENLKFQRPTDFVINIKGNNESKVLVDAYYDSFYYTYADEQYMIPKQKEYEQKNSGIFNPIYLCLNRELYLPQDKKTLPLSKYETGKLKLGDANPSNKDYNSLTDFSVEKDNIEIRIPWALLNVMDPSNLKAIDDFHAIGSVQPMDIKGFYVGGALVNSKEHYVSNMVLYSWQKWDMPTYHERLKPSYYILKNALKDIGDKY
jgi:hypothetical protein